MFNHDIDITVARAFQRPKQYRNNRLPQIFFNKSGTGSSFMSAGRKAGVTTRGQTISIKSRAVSAAQSFKTLHHAVLRRRDFFMALRHPKTVMRLFLKNSFLIRTFSALRGATEDKSCYLYAYAFSELNTQMPVCAPCLYLY
ncbi:hypothetical protein KCP71_02685 [Salmonella enterica subsp. enterica]|nr:hypothetical protein KCP71_02685 [Salmonella enterica subsp. enterica]